MSFAASFPIRFADCDPAGIAYFPRLLMLVDAAIEDWTAATLGIDRRAIHLDRRLGLPTVTLETEFARPARLGDRLTLAVRVDRLGTSSITLAVSGSIGGTACLGARLVQVLTDLDTMRPTPWPNAWRAALSPEPQEPS